MPRDQKGTRELTSVIFTVRRSGVELDNSSLVFNTEILWLTEIPYKIGLDSTRLGELDTLNTIGWLEVDISLEVSSIYPKTWT